MKRIIKLYVGPAMIAMAWVKGHRHTSVIPKLALS